jgi:2'-5' RNA ligase
MMGSNLSKKYTQQWVRYRVHSHSILQEIQKMLSPYVSGRYNQIETTDYHVTVVPQFMCPQDNLHKYHSYLYELFPERTPITVTEAYFYPSKREPRVICLNVETPEFDFIGKRDELIRRIENGEHSETMLDPVNPHITLFTIDDPMDSTMKLPPQANKLYEQVEKAESEFLPFTFNETELKLSSVSNPD